MSAKKILFIHGLESGVLGKKAAYLCQHYGDENVIVPAMETGLYTTAKNSFLMHGIYNLGFVFSGRYSQQVAHSVLQSVVAILKEELRKNSFDLIIGSSMGGATIIEALSRVEEQLLNCPILVLAPALKKVRSRFGFNDSIEGITSGAPMSMNTVYSLSCCQ
jgi:hypothetical protein